MLDLSNLSLWKAITVLIILVVIACLTFFMDDLKIKWFDDLKFWK